MENLCAGLGKLYSCLSGKVAQNWDNITERSSWVNEENDKESWSSV